MLETSTDEIYQTADGIKKLPFIREMLQVENKVAHLVNKQME